MNKKTVYTVVTVWHAQGRDRTFLHGVFDKIEDAEAVLEDVRTNRGYIKDEGYSLEKEVEHSCYIAAFPMNIRVNDFVPTVI